MLIAFNLLPAVEVCAELGARCKLARLAKNWGQAELARRAGVSLSSVRRLESKGQGAIEMWVRVAQVLGFSEHLQPLFVSSVQTIVQAEAAQAVSLRKRARRKNTVKPAHAKA